MLKRAVFMLEGPRAAKLKELPKITRLASSVFFSSSARAEKCLA